MGSAEGGERRTEAASSVRGALFAATEQIQDAIATAQGAAAAILEEAEAEARRRLEAADLEARELVARRLAALTEAVAEVMARAETTGQEVEALGRAAANARARMADVAREDHQEGSAEGAVARTKPVTAEGRAPAPADTASPRPPQDADRPRPRPGEGPRHQETLASLRERFRRGSRGEADSEPSSLILPRMRSSIAGGIERGRAADEEGVQAADDDWSADAAQSSRGRAGSLAVQMAVAGENDEDIERRLREEFDPEEIDQALAEVRRLEGRS